MSTALVELNFVKTDEAVYIDRKGTCLGCIRWNKERGYLFHPTDYSEGISMVELGMIRAKMIDIQAGW